MFIKLIVCYSILIINSIKVIAQTNLRFTSMNIEFQLLIASQNWELIEPYIATLRQISPPQQIGFNHQDKANLVRFYLYTEESLSPREIIFDNLDSLLESGLKRDYPIKIVIHGFAHNFLCSPLHNVKDAYLMRGSQVNIIAVDWPALSRNLNSRIEPITALLNYELAVQDAQIVGNQVGNFITFLVQNNMTMTRQIHIIGFSVGAHVGGMAAQQIQRNGLTKLGRITGLDPAGPLFATGLIGRHLTGDDAEFVDFIHTDLGQAGTVRNLGQANFFVNGGMKPQPGCQFQNQNLNGGLNQQEIGSGSLISNIVLAACSHSAAVNYYAQSILWSNIYAKSCVNNKKCVDNYCHGQEDLQVHFGEDCPPETRGNFCLNMEPVKISMVDSNCNSVAFLGIK